MWMCLVILQGKVFVLKIENRLNGRIELHGWQRVGRAAQLLTGWL